MFRFLASIFRFVINVIVWIFLGFVFMMAGLLKSSNKRQGRW